MFDKQERDHPVRWKTSTMLFYLLCCINAENICHHNKHIPVPHIHNLNVASLDENVILPHLSACFLDFIILF